MHPSLANKLENIAYIKMVPFETYYYTYIRFTKAILGSPEKYKKARELP